MGRKRREAGVRGGVVSHLRHKVTKCEPERKK